MRVVSLFSGAGGLDLGFAQAGFEIAWANDNNPDSVETYRNAFGNHIVCADVEEIKLDQIPKAEIIIGGPPCQGFSVAGKMDPKDPRSKLVWAFCSIVGQKMPAVFVMENVKALGTLSKWKPIRDEIVARMSKRGYRVEMGILNSKDYGVPQSRERVFFVGARTDKELPILLSPRKTKSKSAREVLASLGPPGLNGNNGVCRAKITPAKKPVMRRSPYAGMLFNGLGRPIDLDGPSPTLPASMGGNKTPIIDERSLSTGEENWVVSYHAHLMNGGHPIKKTPPFLRRLTVRECARLQTFPDDFTFYGSQSSQYCQIGNAVPPKLAYAIARKIFQAFSRND